MGVLLDRLQRELAELGAERDRIEAQAVRDLAQVDTKMAVLGDAAKVITTEVEASYAALLRLGLIAEVTK